MKFYATVLVLLISSQFVTAFGWGSGTATNTQTSTSWISMNTAIQIGSNLSGWLLTVKQKLWDIPSMLANDERLLAVIHKAQDLHGEVIFKAKDTMEKIQDYPLFKDTVNGAQKALNTLEKTANSMTNDPELSAAVNKLLTESKPLLKTAMSFHPLYRYYIALTTLQKIVGIVQKVADQQQNNPEVLAASKAVLEEYNKIKAEEKELENAKKSSNSINSYVEDLLKNVWELTNQFKGAETDPGTSSNWSYLTKAITSGAALLSMAKVAKEWQG